MRITKGFLFIAITSIVMMSFTTTAQKWDFLGQRKVSFGADRDEIRVTAKDGAFTKIKLQVRKAPVEFKKVIVHYRNGTTETVEMRDHIQAGGETRAIDLNGNRRIITKVVFYYKSKIATKRRGTVKLLGRH